MKQRIPKRASAFVNMKTVLGRIEKRGHLEAILKIISDAKTAEETELKQELEADSQVIGEYSDIFRENLKVVLGIIVDEVWAENGTPATRASKDSFSGKEVKSQPQNKKSISSIAKDKPNSSVSQFQDTAEELHSNSKGSEHSMPYSMGQDEQYSHEMPSQQFNKKGSNAQKEPLNVRRPSNGSKDSSKLSNTLRTNYMTTQMNRIKDKGGMSTQHASRSRSPLHKSIDQCHTAREKTQFLSSLVHSEFSTINQAGTFYRTRRDTNPAVKGHSPGPSEYRTEVINKAKGGTIGKSKRQFLVNEKEASHSPGPHDYNPKYRFVAKQPVNSHQQKAH